MTKTSPLAWRLAVRNLRKTPAASGAAVLVLALGIGLTGTMFSVVHGTFLRGLPFEGSERLVRVERVSLTGRESRPGVPLHDYLAWRAESADSVDLAAWLGAGMMVSGTGGPPDGYGGAYVTPGFFDVVDVPPILGRTFDETDVATGTDRVIVISHGLWESRFDRRSDILGTSLRVYGQPTTIVGVMPEGFRFPLNQDLWAPLRLDPERTPRGQGPPLQIVGRLKGDIPLAGAEARLAGVASRLADSFPDSNRGFGVEVEPYVWAYTASARPILTLMFLATFGVFLIGGANVANLQLVRGLGQARQIAIRATLGETRRSIALQSFLEAMLLAGAGATLGLGLTLLGIRLYQRLGGLVPSFWVDVRMDWPVVGCLIGLGLLAGAVSGGLPAMWVARRSPAEVLKTSGTSSSSKGFARFHRLSVALQVAVTCGLLIATGLLIRSVIQLQDFDLGEAPGEVFTAGLAVPFQHSAMEDRIRFLEGVLRSVGTLPGIGEVGFASRLPTDRSQRSPVEIEGRSGTESTDLPTARQAAVNPGFFRVLDRVPDSGRNFDASDTLSSLPVAIVNRSFAERFFPDESPLGRRLRLVPGDQPGPWRTIVGIVPDMFLGRDMYESSLGLGHPEGLYLPLAQAPPAAGSFVIRTAGPPAEITEAIRDRVAAVDPDLAVSSPSTLEDHFSDAIHEHTLSQTAFVILALAALLLAAVGLTGLILQDTERRVPELAIREALGARKAENLRILLQRGLVLVLLGLVPGLLFGVFLASWIETLLVGLEAWDPLVLAMVSGVLLLVSLLAILAGAHKVLHIDLADSLREL